MAWSEIPDTLEACQEEIKNLRNVIDKMCGIKPAPQPENLEAWESLIGRAVACRTKNMVTYGVLRGVTMDEITLIPRGGSLAAGTKPVTVARERVTNMHELNNPEKVGLRHD